MKLVKRLHIFMLQTFLPLFAMTFLIVLFIVLMQFLWKYIDSLVGKGLGMDVLGELFFYAAVSMIPMALPLAILLASLMTFGNLGEKFELTAMKASGISLLRVMAPLIGLVCIIAVGAFFFQNDILPKAQVKMWTLLFSVRQKSPEVEIPENVFYDQIPGYNLLVKEKNKETGMLYDVMIYDVNHGDNVTILLADSARMAMTPEMSHLYLHLYEGEQFENLREQRTNDRNVPFRRETFFDKQILIPFDANFNRLDEQGMRQQYVGKNIAELHNSIDSIGHRVDSIGNMFSSDLRRDASSVLPRPEMIQLTYPDGTPNEYALKRQEEMMRHNEELEKATRPFSIDSVLNSMPPAEASRMVAQALGISREHQNINEFKSLTMEEEKKSIRRHEIELIKKYTLSVACIIFFFIGAPLGAIIRKGGLGTPLVVSIFLFLIYYIFDNTGYKLARDGRWPVAAGIWLSTMVLAPLGAYVTWKAMNDSSVFDADRYKNFFRNLFGLRSSRHVALKEVIIRDIDNDRASRMLGIVSHRCDMLADGMKKKGNLWKSFVGYYVDGIDTHRIHKVSDEINRMIDYLSDCRNPRVVMKLSEIPIIRVLWVYAPTPRRWLGYAVLPILPISVPLWLYGEKCLRNLHKDLTKTVEICNYLQSEYFQGQ
ncbi:MAG: LptF/LptG family permease [Muribaculaceae bacterium]|nr:LptF/LptG family permease [Muribaculaceae bacterium]